MRKRIKNQPLLESSEDASTKTESESDNSALAEAEVSPYPLLAAPSTIGSIKFALVAEESYCIFDGEKYGYIAESLS